MCIFIYLYTENLLVPCVKQNNPASLLQNKTLMKLLAVTLQDHKVVFDSYSCKK